MILFSKTYELSKMNLFIKLAKELEKNKKQVKSLVFNLTEKKYYKKYGINYIEVFKKNIDINDEINKYSLEEIEDILSFEKETRKNFQKKDWERILLKYLSFLKIINDKKKIKISIMWNNSTLYERALYYFCKKNNIKFYVLEQGYFRPFTLAFDSKGVNADASISKEKKFYKNITIDRKRLIEYLTKPEYAVISNNLDKPYLYNIFRLIDKIKIFNKKFYDITENTIWEYINRKIKKNKAETINKINIDKMEYIFIPFQVELDSQIILNSSRIKKMSELYEIVSKAVKKYNNKNKNKIKAIFKAHPMDYLLNIEEIKRLENEYNETIFLTSGDTKELIKQSKGVITINSTVGIEALCEYKPLITLGEAFYNIEGIAQYCKNYDNLYEDIEKIFNKETDQNLIDKFLYYLRFNYFKEIYWRNPDDNSIKKIVNEILDKENYV